MSDNVDYVLVTGGAGFIGSNYINLYGRENNIHIINLDKLTYAGDLKNLQIENNDRYTFVQGDIVDQQLVGELFKQYKFKRVVNFAAESHVDRSQTHTGAGYLGGDFEGDSLIGLDPDCQHIRFE